MLRKLKYLILILLSLLSLSFTQIRSLYIGGIELRLGMPREAAISALSAKYDVSTSNGNSFVVTDRRDKSIFFGSIAFENDKVSYLSRAIDTSGWPNDEGYAITRSLHEVLNGAIPSTDSDGAKRANVSIVLTNRDYRTSSFQGSLREIGIFVNQRKILILIDDSTRGKSVGVSESISTRLQ